MLLDPGTSVAAAEASIQQVLPKGFPIEFYVTSLTAAKAERASEPTSLALAVFGGIAAVAALLIAGQVIGRQLRLGAGDLGTLRALGASPAVTTGDGLPGVLGTIVVGALLACAFAVGLSPLAPLGSIRAVYPYPGVAFDWAVLGAGFALFVCRSLAAAAAVIAVPAGARTEPSAASRKSSRATGSAVERVAASAAGLPAAAAEETSGWPRPPRGAQQCAGQVLAILGTVLATVVLPTATVTFERGRSTRLVSHPVAVALAGTGRTALSSGVITLITTRRRPSSTTTRRSPRGRASGFSTAQIDDVTVPVLGTDTKAPVVPSAAVRARPAGTGARWCSARRPFARKLHKRVGDVVTVTDGGPHPFQLRIVGTATLPSMGVAATLHTEMGTGAVLPYQDIPRHQRQPAAEQHPGAPWSPAPTLPHSRRFSRPSSRPA